VSKSVTMCPFVLTQYRHWADRQTDRQTDRTGKTILRSDARQSPTVTFAQPSPLSQVKKVKLAHLIWRHLQSWTAALYNLGSGSWLAMTAVPRRTQWQPRARANGLLGPQLQPAGILRPSQPR